jgi:hypothetical protein
MSSDQAPEDQQENATPRSKIKSRQEIEQEKAPTPVRRPTPTSLLLYVGLVIVMYIYWAVFPGYPPLELEANLGTSIFIRLLVIFLLINRSVVGWFIGIVLEAIYIITFSFQIASIGGDSAAKLWGLLFLAIAALALLLTRTSRQHVWSKGDAAEAPAAPSGQAEPDQAGSSSSSRSSSST